MLQRRGGYLQTRTATASQAVGHPDLARRPFFLLVKPTTTARLSTRPRRRDRPLSRTSRCPRRPPPNPSPLSRTVERAAVRWDASPGDSRPQQKKKKEENNGGKGWPDLGVRVGRPQSVRISFEPIRLENRASVGPCARARALSTRTRQTPPPPPSTNKKGVAARGNPLPPPPHTSPRTNPHRTGPTCRRPFGLTDPPRGGCEWNDRKATSPVGKSRMEVNPNVGGGPARSGRRAAQHAAMAPHHGSSSFYPDARTRATMRSLPSFLPSFLPFGTTEGDGRARRFEDRRRQHVRSSVRYLIFSPYPLLAVTPVSLTAPHLSSPLPPITGHVDAEDELV
ncbi:hypothetical protein BHM03_00004634 [Ensete ventricosum]|nr:hypothetical protein BHM03_00004634 [Ensete ventricosum]